MWRATHETSARGQSNLPIVAKAAIRGNCGV